MPAPKPNPGEEKNDFVSRCIKFFHDEDSDMTDEQIQAACYDAWDRAKEGRELKFEKEGFDLVAKFEVRFDEEKRPIIEGYAAVFDSLSEDLGGFRERIAPGAFSAALKGDSYLFWNHNSDIILARKQAGTLKLSEDKHGLKIEAKPPEWAKSYVESVQRGDVSAMSFGFITESDEWDHKRNIRTLTKIAELPEVSIVPFPAYKKTNVQMAYRSRDFSLKSTDEAEPMLADSEEIDQSRCSLIDPEDIRTEMRILLAKENANEDD